MQKITPFLWYDDNAEEAINFYGTVFKNVKVNTLKKYPGGPMEGKVMMASFEIEGQKFNAMDAGPTFKFTEAISMMVDCEDQAEVDEYWNKLTADGGEESQCGWLKDKFGLSWQIIPKALIKLLNDPDPERANRAMQAMLGMKKIVVADLEKAAEGK
jgi:predicted 3-demethylubiquinone-9 3-methyltransferase (glyoxalase superfamily)